MSQGDDRGRVAAPTPALSPHHRCHVPSNRSMPLGHHPWNRLSLHVLRLSTDCLGQTTACSEDHRLPITGGISSYDRILRNVVKDHGSGTYPSMVTYRYAPTDSSIRTYPNTVADRYRLRRFYALASLLCHNRMTGTSENYSRRNEYVFCLRRCGTCRGRCLLNWPHKILLNSVLRLLAVGNDVFAPDHNACCFMFAIIPL